MHPKFSPNFWADMAEHPPEVKLSFTWAFTNTEVANSMLGIFTWRPRQFTFDTGLQPEFFLDTIKAMPRAFVQQEDRVWVKHFIGFQYGDSLSKNTLILKGLISRLESLPRRFKQLQEAILEAYPDLKGHTSPLQAPLSGLLPPADEDLPNLLPNPKGAQMLLQSEAPSEAPCKVLEGTRAEQSRAEQSSPPSGESEGAGPGALVPEEPTVVEFGRKWAGDSARGIPPGIPEGYVLSWLAWRLGETAPAFPRDWRADLVRRFTADWVKGRADTRHAPRGEKSAGPDRNALVAELAKADPARRKEILKLLKNAA